MTLPDALAYRNTTNDIESHIHWIPNKIYEFVLLYTLFFLFFWFILFCLLLDVLVGLLSERWCSSGECVLFVLFFRSYCCCIGFYKMHGKSVNLRPTVLKRSTILKVIVLMSQWYHAVQTTAVSRLYIQAYEWSKNSASVPQLMICASLWTRQIVI